MTRAEIERRLKLLILQVAVAAMTDGATKRAAEIEAIKELILTEVQEIVAETKAATLRTVASVRGVA
jgi:hypothetical protein